MVAPPRLAPPFTACNSIKKENYATQVLIIVSSILGGLVLLCFGALFAWRYYQENMRS